VTWIMLVRDYFYPAAERAGIIFRQEDGSYVDSSGQEAADELDRKAPRVRKSKNCQLPNLPLTDTAE